MPSSELEPAITSKENGAEQDLKINGHQNQQFT
jgi:hypothetical protein